MDERRGLILEKHQDSETAKSADLRHALSCEHSGYRANIALVKSDINVAHWALRGPPTIETESTKSWSIFALALPATARDWRRASLRRHLAPPHQHAPRPMPIPHRALLRHRALAYRLRPRAAWREGAAVRQVGEIGRGARDGGEAFALVEGAAGPGGEEADGVGVGGRADDIAALASLDDAAGIHHGDAVGDLGR